MWDQNPESARTVVGPAAPARRRLATSSSTNRTTPRAEPAGAFAHAGGEHFAGVGACGQQRVIAQHLGVAVRGAALVLAVDLTDRGVQIDRQRLVAGACA